MKKLYPLVIWCLCAFLNSLNAQTGTWNWAKSGAPTNTATVPAISHDAEGNVYATGSFTGNSITLGTTTLYNTGPAGTNDIFITKSDSFGHLMWAKGVIGWGGASNDLGCGIYADAQGNVYVSGIFQSDSIQLGDITLYNINAPNDWSNIYLAKFDASGNVIWARAGEGAGDYRTPTISADGAGNVYVAALVFGVAALMEGDTIVPQNSSVQNILSMKFDAGGNFLWSRLGSGNQQEIFASASMADAAGNFYVTGYFTILNKLAGDFISFGNDSVSNPNNDYSYDFFLVKYDTAGNVLWARGADSFGSIYARGLYADAGGDVYLTGDFQSGFLELDGHIIDLPVSELNGVFVSRFDASGHALWLQAAGNTKPVSGTSLSADAGGNIYVAGNYKGASITFGNSVLTNANYNPNSGTTDMFIVKYDPDGKQLWTGSVGGIGNERATCISVLSNNDFYLAGSFSSPVLWFGTSVIIADSGITDYFIGKHLGLPDTTAPIQTGLLQANLASAGIKVYPNPSNDQFCFEGMEEGSTLEICNVLGEMMFASKPSGNLYRLDLSGQAKGIYFYRIGEAGGSLIQGKLVLE